jgi:hypothetical protein
MAKIVIVLPKNKEQLNLKINFGQYSMNLDLNFQVKKTHQKILYFS